MPPALSRASGNRYRERYRLRQMRLAVKSTAALIVLYLLVLVCLVLWMEYQLRSTANSLMEGTARLVGTEVALPCPSRRSTSCCRGIRGRESG